jgi:hypothetical protein
LSETLAYTFVRWKAGAKDERRAYLLRLRELKLEFTSPVLDVLQRGLELSDAIIALNPLLQFTDEPLRSLEFNFQPLSGVLGKL